jgi:hypothetical protein
MRKRILGTIILFANLSHIEAQELSSNVVRSRSVAARVFYPFISFKDKTFRQNQKNYLGMGLLYQFFVWDQIGFFFEPTISGIPIAQGDSKAKLANGGINFGVTLRPLPLNWFDPQLKLMSGVAAQDAGSLTTLTFSWPLGGRGELSLYSNRAPYQDSTLALVLSGQFQYYIHQLSILNERVYDVGLGLRGSF